MDRKHSLFLIFAIVVLACVVLLIVGNVSEKMESTDLDKEKVEKQCIGFGDTPSDCFNNIKKRERFNTDTLDGERHSKDEKVLKDLENQVDAHVGGDRHLAPYDTLHRSVVAVIRKNPVAVTKLGSKDMYNFLMARFKMELDDYTKHRKEVLKLMAERQFRGMDDINQYHEFSSKLVDATLKDRRAQLAQNLRQRAVTPAVFARKNLGGRKISNSAPAPSSSSSVAVKDKFDTKWDNNLSVSTGLELQVAKGKATINMECHGCMKVAELAQLNLPQLLKQVQGSVSSCDKETDICKLSLSKELSKMSEQQRSLMLQFQKQGGFTPAAEDFSQDLAKDTLGPNATSFMLKLAAKGGKMYMKASCVHCVNLAKKMNTTVPKLSKIHSNVVNCDGGDCRTVKSVPSISTTSGAKPRPLSQSEIRMLTS